MTNKRLILASTSPRRREILSLLTANFDVIPSNADEECSITDPSALVLYLSQLKARDVFAQNKDAVVIGADTVVFAKGRILGKPKDETEAREFLRLLSASEHSVFTGVCVKADSGEICSVCETKVLFDAMSEKNIEAYVSSGECMDKAGAYAVQGGAAQFIKSINGCYYNVVGLPLNEVWRMLGDI